MISDTYLFFVLIAFKLSGIIISIWQSINKEMITPHFAVNDSIHHGCSILLVLILELGIGDWLYVVFAYVTYLAI